MRSPTTKSEIKERLRRALAEQGVPRASYGFLDRHGAVVVAAIVGGKAREYEIDGRGDGAILALAQKIAWDYRGQKGEVR